MSNTSYTQVESTLVLTPAFVTKRQAVYVLASPVLLKRAMCAGRLLIVRQGGRGSSTLIDFRSLMELVEFLRNGGELPLLPSERNVAA